MRSLLTLIGKSILLVLALMRRKGTALPGLVIERLYPRYLNLMLDQLPRGVIIVTGTNGKTTTTKVITELLQASGLKVLTNPTGSNFVRGIIAAIAKHATVTGKLPYDIAVFEQDEAHAVHFAKQYQPIGVVALNVMRDQMDRFGEIDMTAKLIGKLVARAKSWVVLNTNDKRIAALSEQAGDRHIVWFGHSQSLQRLFIDDDQLYSRKPEFYEAATPSVLLTQADAGKLGVTIQNKTYHFSTPLEGTHNSINIAAALAALIAAEPSADINQAIGTLETIRPAFGRGEVVHLANGSTLRLQLVKNPSGFRHSLQLANAYPKAVVGLAINDDFPDGRDVSWLWDVDFTGLQGRDVMTGGMRAADMMVRLKYDGVQAQQTVAELPEFLALLADRPDRTALIFCTYTAMLRLRTLLKRHNRELHKEGL